MIKSFFIFSIFLLISCQSENITYNYPKDIDDNKKINSIVFNTKNTAKTHENEKSSTNKVNLWNNSIKYLSRRYPILIADKNSNLISSDWSKLNDNTRIKVNAFITNEKLEITVFKETLKNSEWISDGQDKDLSEKIKNEILAL